MARTHGHGNPNWSREEVILALDLYFDCKGSIPSDEDARVQSLSQLLRSLAYHRVAARKESFRNSAGVAFKLQNLRQIATGHGLENVSKTDKAVWRDFGQYPGKIKELAELIRIGIRISDTKDESCDEDEEFPEGRTLTAIHKRRERNRKVKGKLMAARKLIGVLKCEM